MKPEPFDGADLRLCGAPLCRALAARVAEIAPHTDPAAKASQRDRVLAAVAQRLAAGRSPVNVYLFDDRLARCPTGPSGPKGPTGPTLLLTAELLGRFGAEHIRVWSPNLKADVAEELRALAAWAPGAPTDWLTVGAGCWCAFHDRWDAAVRAAGGLDVVFADCFGAFETGAGRFLADCVARRWFRNAPTDTVVTDVLWAVSVRASRCADGGTSAAGCALRLLRECAVVFDGEAAYTHRLVADHGHGPAAAMHFVALEVRPRACAPPGFTSHVVYCEDDA